MTTKKNKERKIIPGESFAYRNSLLPENPWELMITSRKFSTNRGEMKIALEDPPWGVNLFGTLEELLLEAQARGIEPEVLDFIPDIGKFFWEGILEPFGKEKDMK